MTKLIRGFLAWLMSPHPDAEKEEEDKEVEREVFSEEFEWMPHRIVREYGRGWPPIKRYIPITLTGRWRIDKERDGASHLYLEFVTSVEKTRNYLNNYGNHDSTEWLLSSDIELKAKAVTTINECSRNKL